LGGPHGVRLLSGRLHVANGFALQFCCTQLSHCSASSSPETISGLMASVEFSRSLVVLALVPYSTQLINDASTPSSNNFAPHTPQVTRPNF